MPRLREAIVRAPTRTPRGRIEQVSGTLVKARIGGVRVGQLCLLRDPAGDTRRGRSGRPGRGLRISHPAGDVSGLSSLAEVEPSGRRLSVAVGMGLLGRVLDGLGRPLEQSGAPFVPEAAVPLEAPPPPPLDRPLVTRLLPFGTRAIDGLLACADGQRIGIFGPAGAGKSTLMAQPVKGAEADVFVIALVGERGREVAKFLEHTLGPEARKCAAIDVLTSRSRVMGQVAQRRSTGRPPHECDSFLPAMMRWSCWCGWGSTRPAATSWQTRRCARSRRSARSCRSLATPPRRLPTRCGAWPGWRVDLGPCSWRQKLLWLAAH